MENVSHAAKEASIRARYSEKTAKQAGTENLSKLVISKAINKATDVRSEKMLDSSLRAKVKFTSSG